MPRPPSQVCTPIQRRSRPRVQATPTCPTTPTVKTPPSCEREEALVKSRTTSLVLAAAVVAALVPLGAAPASAQLPPPGSAQSWFFAEGNTLPNWFEFITIINPDPSNDIVVNVQYQLEEPAGVPRGTSNRIAPVPAGQRTTLAVYDDLGRAVGAGPGATGV